MMGPASLQEILPEEVLAAKVTAVRETDPGSELHLRLLREVQAVWRRQRESVDQAFRASQFADRATSRFLDPAVSEEEYWAARFTRFAFAEGEERRRLQRELASEYRFHEDTIRRAADAFAVATDLEGTNWHFVEIQFSEEVPVVLP